MTVSLSNSYISSSCFTTKNLKELLNICKTNNFQNLELSGSLDREKDYLNTLKENIDNFNFLIHNYFPPSEEPLVINLASANKNIRAASVKQCQKSIQLCQQLNIPFFSVHGGFLFDPEPESLGQKQSDFPFIGRNLGLKLFRDSISQLLETDFDLLIENNVNSHENLIDGKNQLYLLAEPQETVEFLQHFNSKNLGLLVDLGHLNVSAQQLGFDKYQYLKIIKPWVKAFHLSSNDGNSDQGLAFDANEWFIQILKKFPSVSKIIEINNKNSHADLTRCVSLVNNL